MAPSAAPAAADAAAAVCDGASYHNRIDNPGYYDWCIVPNTSYDVVLFGGLAVVLACLFVGKLNTLMVLAAGSILMAIAWPVNLGALGNSLAIWLGISPWQLFFYVFLPPLLLDAAVRIDWYLFRKSVIQVFTLAFLVVGATCVAMIPIMLYILDLRKYGWEWIHACMFGAMIASTDAVAIVSIMKTSGGPKRLRVLLEGESLLNDASGLTLFEVFFHILHTQMAHPEEQEPVHVIVGHVFLAVVQLGLIGFVMGMVFGILTRLFLRFMRYMGASHDQEVALTLGMAYLAYWVTGIPCKGSGVVAVAVMGLYGASTNCWDMSTAAHHTFDGFWETLAFVVNSLVFMWSGAHVVNFFIRAILDLQAAGLNHDLETTLWLLPIIYIILTLLRFGLSSMFRPLFILIKGDINTKEMLFVTMAGLRGSASLIMGSAVVTQQFSKVSGSPDTFSVVKAMMVFWTAGFVLMTLGINAPMLPFVLHVLGLSKVPDKQLERRKRAVDALASHSREVMEQLRDAEDELLAGVDWAQVAAFADHGRKYSAFLGHTKPPGPISRLLLRLWSTCCCCCPCLPAWLTGSSAAAAAAAAQQQQQKQHDGDHHKGNHGGSSHPPHEGSSHHSRRHKRRWGKRRDRPSSDLLQHTTAKGVPADAAAGAAAAALVAQPVEKVVAQLVLGASSDAEAPRSVGGAGSASAGGARPTNGTAAAGWLGAPVAAAPSGNGSAAAARLTGDSQGNLWGSGLDETTEPGRGTQSPTSSSSSSSLDSSRNGRPLAGALQQQPRHASGNISDTERSSSSGSSSGSSSDVSDSGSSSRDSRVSRYDSNLINDVLPFLQAHEIDVMQQECPFLMSRAAHHPAHATTGSSTGGQQRAAGQQLLPVSEGGQQQKLQRKGFADFFGRWRKAPAAAQAAAAAAVAASEGASNSSRRSWAGGIEMQGGASSSPKAQSQPTDPRLQPAMSAYAAALAPRASFSTDGPAAGSFGRPPPVLPPGRANRSLASRSAAPALVYGSTWSSAGTGSAGGAASNGSEGGINGAPPLLSPQPGHRRRGSDSLAGLTVTLEQQEHNPVQQQQQQMSRPLSSAAATGTAAAAAAGKKGSWGLAGSWSGLQDQDSAPASGSPRAASAAAAVAAAGGAGGRAPGLSGTEKVLGRRSGMYGRSLGTRSTNLADRYGVGPDSFTPFQPFHLPEAEAAEGSPLARNSRSFAASQLDTQGGSSGAGGARTLRRVSSERQRHSAHVDAYDAAAVAVDMVSLERSSSSSKTRPGAAAAAGGSVGREGLSRAGSRGLAARSVGMAGLYGSADQQGSYLGDAAAGLPAGYRRAEQRASPNPELKSLATRSSNPHLPPVAPVAPSLATISTGLAAYNSKTSAAAADGSSGRQLPWGSSGRADRSLAASSVPVAGIVAAAAAASFASKQAQQQLAAAGGGGTGGGSSTGGDGGSTGGAGGIFRSSTGIARFSRKSAGKFTGRSVTDDDEGYSDTSRPSEFGKDYADGGLAAAMGEADLADARSWLVTGLKRYFHAKRMEGLLSARGLRILDSGCEVLLEAPDKPLHLWSTVSGDCANNTVVRLLTYLLFCCRQAAVWFMSFGKAGRLLAWPLRVAASMLQRPLNKVLLISVEVAMEYLMGLTTSPHVEQLQENEAWAALLAEISSEAGQVAQFLIDREIEAPERYSAVQSYRVAMAVLRQQRLFVDTLFESGMLDAAETSQLSHPIEAAERRLELLGPVWRAPSLMEVLRQLPFLRGQPEGMVDFFVKHGQLVMLGKGNSLALDKVLYVVQSGIVKVTYSPDMGEVQEYFLGSGGLINLYCSLTGEAMPGVTEAIAQGNALGKGPVLFCLGAKGLRRLGAAAAAGDPAFQQLELDMYRLAGLFLLERLKPHLDMEASQALARLAPLTTGSGSSSSTSGGAHHRDKRSTRQQRAAWVRARLAVMRARLKAQLVMSELLVLSEGAVVMQDSHVVLMKGTIQVKVADDSSAAQPAGTADISRWMAIAGRHQHQSILPWFWDVLSSEDLQRAPAGTPLQPPAVSITAGAEGATLLVCPSLEAAAALAAEQQQQQQQQPTVSPAGALASAQPLQQGAAAVGVKPSGLSRHSPGPLSRISPPISRGLGAGAAGAGGPGVGHRAAGAVANPYSRRSLAASAAAADLLMEPCPGVGPKAGMASATTAAAAGSAGLGIPAAVGAAAAGGDAKRGLSRVSPSLARRSQELQRSSDGGGKGKLPTLARTSSEVPLAGAQCDNAVSLGVDMRAGPLSSLGTGQDAAAAAAAAHASGSLGEGAAGAAAAGAGRAGWHRQQQQQQLRRSKSQRPLKASAGAAVGERRIGGGGGGH